MADDAKESQDQKVENQTAEWLGDGEARNFAVEGNDLSGYIGVSPEYMTYADETHKPYSTEEEVLSPAEQLMFEADDEDDEEEADKKAVEEQTKKEEPRKATASPSSTTAGSKASTAAPSASKSTSSK